MRSSRISRRRPVSGYSVSSHPRYKSSNNVLQRASPSKRVVKDKVVYEEDRSITPVGRRFRNYGAAAGSMLGGAIGSRYGIPRSISSSIGSIAGQGLGAALSKITGNGDYIISNSLIKGGDSPNVSFGNGRIRIRHREYIQDLQGSTGFNIQQLEINPGLASTFPFLSQLASNFETYEMHGLVFEYKATSADALNSTNTALGVVVMAVQYNCLNTTFANKQSMEAYEGAVSVRPSVSSICGVECAKGRLPLSDLYVRVAAVASGQDERFYDMGEFNIATQGMQAVADIGELWVSYDVTLKYPKLLVANPPQSAWDHYQASSAISTSAYWGTNTTIVSGGTDSGVSFPSGTTLAFYYSFADSAFMPPGNYLIIYSVQGSSSTAVGPSFSLGSAFTALDSFKNGSSFFLNLADTNTKCLRMAFVTYSPDLTTSANNLITLSGGTLPTTPTGMDLIILSLPEGWV